LAATRHCLPSSEVEGEVHADGRADEVEGEEVDAGAHGVPHSTPHPPVVCGQLPSSHSPTAGIAFSDALDSRADAASGAAPRSQVLSNSELPPSSAYLLCNRV
jgi:hypothetical protein